MSGPTTGPRASVGQWIGYVAGRSVFALLGILPLRAARAAGAGLGHLFFLVSSRHRGIARRNLASALGDRLQRLAHGGTLGACDARGFELAQRSLICGKAAGGGWKMLDPFPMQSHSP